MCRCFSQISYQPPSLSQIQFEFHCNIFETNWTKKYYTRMDILYVLMLYKCSKWISHQRRRSIVVLMNSQTIKHVQSNSVLSISSDKDTLYWNCTDWRWITCVRLLHLYRHTIWIYIYFFIILFGFLLWNVTYKGQRSLWRNVWMTFFTFWISQSRII